MLIVEDKETNQSVRFFHGYTKDFPNYVEVNYGIPLYSNLMSFAKDGRRRVDVSKLLSLTEQAFDTLCSHPNPMVRIAIADAHGLKNIDFSKAEGRDENFFYFRFGRHYLLSPQRGSEVTYSFVDLVRQGAALLNLLRSANASGHKVKVRHAHP